MWPVESNAQLQRRLEHQIRPARKTDRLLNTVTATDREDTLPGSLWFGRLLAKVGKWVSLRRHSPAPAAAMLSRPSH